jgi:U4/U6 small nuclear ribonucleoprotein PRP3
MDVIVSTMCVPVSSLRPRRLPFLTSASQKEALIAQKRAEIAAKLAAMRSGSASAASNTPVPAHPRSPGPTAASAHFAEDVGKRIAEAKRKVAEAQNKLATKDNPYMVTPLLPLTFR